VTDTEAGDVKRQGDELMELIQRGYRSRVESRRILVTSANLIHERERLYYHNKDLFHEIAQLTRDFAAILEQRRCRQEESQS
jgi:hypothetical protein